MRISSLRLAFVVSAVTLAACSGDNFSETDVPAAAGNGGGGSGQAGKAGSASGGTASGGKAGSGIAGTGSTGGNQSTGGAAGQGGTDAGGTDAGGSDAGGSDAGGSDGGSSVGGTSAGTGGKAGASGSNAGGKAGSGGVAGTSAGGAAGTNAGGKAGSSAGGSAGANAGGSSGANAGGSAGATAGGSAGATAGGSAGASAGSGGSAGAGGKAGTGGAGGNTPWGPGKCDPLGGFDELAVMPAPINAVGSNQSDIDGWFDASQNLIVWAKGGTGSDLWFGRLAGDGTTWSDLDDLKGSHSADTDRFPSLSNNQTTLYLTSNRSDHTAGWHIYRIVQKAVEGGLAGWDDTKTMKVEITDSLPNHREFGGQVLADDSALYFASTRRLNKAAYTPNDLDIYVQLHPAIPGGAVTAIGSINTENVEQSHPAISPDQRILYYATREPGRPDLDVWATYRMSTSEAFGTPVKLDAIDTPAIETPSWISEDYCVVLFTRTENGSSKIWKGTRFP